MEEIVKQLRREWQLNHNNYEVFKGRATRWLDAGRYVDAAGAQALAEHSLRVCGALERAIQNVFTAQSLLQIEPGFKKSA